MGIFSQWSCISIFVLFFTLNAVTGNKSESDPCVFYTGEPCVINKIEYALHGKIIKLPCVHDGPQHVHHIPWFKNGKQIRYDSRVMQSYSGKSLTLAIENINYEDDGVYTCMVRSSIESLQTYSINLKVQSLPYFTLTPQNVSVVVGRTAKLICQADGVPKPKIKWMKNNQELSDKRYEVLESGDLLIRDVLFEDAGEYTCVATNVYDSVEASGFLTLKQPTKISHFPKNLELDDGDTAKFTCKAVPDPDLELRFHWLKNGKTINVALEPRFSLNSDSSQITIIRVNELDAGNYTCVASTDLDEISASATLVIYGVPKRPTLLGVNCGTKEAQVSWNTTSDDHWPITYYSIEHNNAYTPYIWRVAEDHIANGNPSYIVKLLPGINYTFRVIAWNKMGPSQPSSHSIACKTPPDVPYKNPDNIEYEPIKVYEMGKLTHYFNIKWKVVPLMEHNAPKFGYRIYVKRDIPGENWTVTSVDYWKTNQYEIETDSSYQRYKIKVTAVNEIGECKEQAQEIIAYSGKVPVQTPSNFTLDKVISNNTASLSWTNNEISEESSHVYKIEVWTKEEVDEASRKSYIIKTNETSVLFDKLIPNSINYVRMYMFNETYTSPPSETIAIDTSGEVTGPVTDLVINQVGSSRMLLRWKKPVAIRGALTGYKITFNKASDPETESKNKMQIKDPKATSIRLSGLSPETKYRVTVHAVTNTGEGQDAWVEKMTQALRRLVKPTFSLHKIPQKNGLTYLKVVREVEQDNVVESSFFVKYRTIEEDIRSSMETPIETETNEIVIQSLENGRSYIISVVSVDGNHFRESDSQTVII